MRLFVALELDASIRRQLGRLIEALRTDAARVRWLDAANIHLTLKFLGEVVNLPELLHKLHWLTQPPPGTEAWACGLRYYHVGVPPGNKPETEDRLLERLVFVV